MACDELAVPGGLALECRLSGSPLTLFFTAALLGIIHACLVRADLGDAVGLVPDQQQSGRDLSEARHTKLLVSQCIQQLRSHHSVKCAVALCLL